MCTFYDIFNNYTHKTLQQGLRRSFATPNHFVLTNKICLNQQVDRDVETW